MEFDNVYSRFTGKPTQEMVGHYYNRTNRHIELVRGYIAKIVECAPDEFGELADRAEVHDQSKFEEPELTPYIWLTHRYKCQDCGEEFHCPDGMDDKMHDATVHHVQNNSHHPEYHDRSCKDPINRDNRDEPSGMIDASGMSKIDVAEMVADWCAVSKERGNTPTEWADANVNKRWKFTTEQVQQIYDTITRIWN